MSVDRNLKDTVYLEEKEDDFIWLTLAIGNVTPCILLHGLLLVVNGMGIECHRVGHRKRQTFELIISNGCSKHRATTMFLCDVDHG